MLGTAVSGAAADELDTAAGIRSETLAQLRVDVDRHGLGETFPTGFVVVVDGSFMVAVTWRGWSTRLNRSTVRSCGPVIDSAQLPLVDSGRRVPHAGDPSDRRDLNELARARMAVDGRLPGRPDAAGRRQRPGRRTGGSHPQRSTVGGSATSTPVP